MSTCARSKLTDESHTCARSKLTDESHTCARSKLTDESHTCNHVHKFNFLVFQSLQLISESAYIWRQQLSSEVSAESRAESPTTTSHNGEKETDRIACFCRDDSEFGEMACCELCSGWFHFRCMRYKENVGLLDNRDFVCCFCIASKTLSLAKEVELLRSEVKELRQKLATHVAEEVTRESDQLEDTAEDETKDHAREEMPYSAAVKRKKSSKYPSGNEKGNLQGVKNHTEEA